MAEETDLIWDHAADVEFESSDMMRGIKRGHSTFYRPDSLKLTYDQAHDLLQVLDNTREIIHSYIEFNEEQEQLSDSLQASRRRCPCLYRLGKKLLPKLFRNITVITVVLQAFNLFILTLIDIWPKKDDNIVIIASATSMIFLQLLNLIATIYTTTILARHLRHRDATAVMLAQNYLAYIMLFAGLYTLTYKLYPKSWKFIAEDLEEDPVLVVVLYAKFLFFSVSTATLCGSDNVLPQEWYNCIFAALQMLLSFVYFASILGQAVNSKVTDFVLKKGQELPSTPRPLNFRRHSYGSISSRGSARGGYSINPDTLHNDSMESSGNNT